MKIKPTNPAVFLEVCGVVGLTMKSIDMYILHDRSVWGLFLEYIGVVCVKVKQNLGMTCLRERVRVKKKAKAVNAIFVRLPRGGGSVTF